MVHQAEFELENDRVVIHTIENLLNSIEPTEETAQAIKKLEDRLNSMKT